MADYIVKQQLPATRRNPDTGALESGLEITYKDAQSGTVGVVFLADDRVTVEGAKLLIEHDLAIKRGIAALGA